MRYLVWILRLAVFAVVLLFATRNTGGVDVGLFADKILHDVPLIVVMLVAFALGMAVGLLLSLGSLLRQKRELGRLRRELARSGATAASEVQAAEAVAPLSPL